MIEITYQMALSTVQTIGILVGIVYYITIMRNTQKTQKMQLVSRIYEIERSVESGLIGIELGKMEWTDFDDFLAKYDSRVNPENFAKRFHWWNYYQEVGYMLHEGIVDVDTVYKLLGGRNSRVMWDKFKPIILEQRMRYEDPDFFKYFEYFADEITKYRDKQGLPLEIKDEYDV
jgi:hypothetical protein